MLATVLDAHLDLVGPEGTRTVPAREFFTGPQMTVRGKRELLAEVRLSALLPGTGVGYAEDRRPHAIFADSAVMAAITISRAEVAAARIGLVNSGPCPTRAHEAEHFLLGAALTDGAIAAAAVMAAQLDARLHSQPADHQLRRYRKVQVLTRRALTQARESS